MDLAILASRRDLSSLRSRGRGFTIIELLVVVAILGLLAALLIPAVMDSRLAASRAACTNHLKQVELATLAYHDAFDAYPMIGKSGDRQRGHARNQAKYYSVFAHIAAQLDQAPLFNQINFQGELVDDVTLVATRQSTYHSIVNTTAMRQVVPVLLCPLDPAPLNPAGSRGTNYRANYGILAGYAGNEAVFGPFTLWGPVSARNVTDGLSQTAAYSEKPRGDVDRATFDRFVDPLVDPMNVDPPAPTEFGYCSQQPIIPANYRTTTGVNWLVGGLTQTCYNHMETPNGKQPDCVLYGYFPGVARSTARSYHGGGANVAMADGSVRFVTATISLNTWMALGTRAGGEVQPDAGE